MSGTVTSLMYLQHQELVYPITDNAIEWGKVKQDSLGLIGPRLQAPEEGLEYAA